MEPGVKSQGCERFDTSTIRAGARKPTTLTQLGAALTGTQPRLWNEHTYFYDETAPYAASLDLHSAFSHTRSFLS